MYLIPTAMIKTVSTLLICGLGYSVTTWIDSIGWTALAEASRPGRQRETAEELAWQLAER
jgi:hypothetical protein